MKREELKELGLSDEQIDKIMSLNGQDIEKHKQTAETAKATGDALKKQLDDATTQIEAFKGMDIEAVKKSADEWKAKAEQASKDAEAQVSRLKFDHALDGALTGAKAKSLKAVKALLDLESLKLNDDGSIAGLEDQIKTIMESKDGFLFESDKPEPKIVSGGNNQTVGNISAFEAAARKGAGLPISEGK